MDADEIIDRRGLDLWLKGQAPEISYLIAHRLAVRQLPFLISQYFGITGAWDEYFNPLNGLRSFLSNGVHSKFPTPELRLVASTAASSLSGSHYDSPAEPAAHGRAVDAAGYALDASARAARGYVVRSEEVRGSFWLAVRNDALRVQAGEDLLDSPLWFSARPEWYDEAEIRTRNIWSRSPETWSFWKRWWDGMLLGRPIDWDLQRAVALIPDQDWKEGPTHISALIAKIEDERTYRVSAGTRVSAEHLMHAAIARFTFVELRQVMKMVPFAEDIQHLRDKIALEAFLSETDTLNLSLEALARAFAAEAGKMQGAGAIKTYIDEVLTELSRSRQLNELNVGWLIECGEILQSYSLNAGVVAEITPLHIPFERAVARLLDVTRRHFSQTLVRFAPLRDIRSNDETRLFDLMEDIRRGLQTIRQSSPETRIPMAPEDLAVFDKMLFEIERMVREEFAELVPQVRASRRKDIDFLMAQVSVSLLLYKESAGKNWKNVERAVQIAGVMEKGAGSLEKLIAWLRGS